GCRRRARPRCRLASKPSLPLKDRTPPPSCFCWNDWRASTTREIQPLCPNASAGRSATTTPIKRMCAAKAQLANRKPDLPPIRFSEEQTRKRLSRLREQLVGDRTSFANQLHACLSGTSGARTTPCSMVCWPTGRLVSLAKYTTLVGGLGGPPRRVK